MTKKKDVWMVVPLLTTDDLVRRSVGRDMDVDENLFLSEHKTAGGLSPLYVEESRQGRVKTSKLKPDLDFLDRHR